MTPAALGSVRHDWSLPEVQALFALPFMDLIFQAQRVHREHHVPNTVQMSTLLSIKTGACPEDCAYCPQSVHYDTGLDRETLLEVAAVYDCETADSIERMLALLGPALTIGLGLVVALVIGSIMITVLSVYQLAI